MAEHYTLDGVLTLVDAKHIGQHLDEKKPDGVVNEAISQVAYADRIILNKTDLVCRPPSCNVHVGYLLARPSSENIKGLLCCSVQRQCRHCLQGIACQMILVMIEAHVISFCCLL